MIIGLAGHPIKLKEIEKVLSTIDRGLELRKLEFTEIAYDVQARRFKELQDCCDIIIIGGYYDYLYFCSNVAFTKVTGYIENNINSLFRSLIVAQCKGYDIANISVDGYTRKELSETYEEIGVDMKDVRVYSWYVDKPLSPGTINELTGFHEKNYQRKSASVCLTCISLVYERLTASGIPAVMIRATYENIRAAYERLRLEYMLRTKSLIDTVILNINVADRAGTFRNEDEYLANVEKLHIAEQIFLFAHKLLAAVEELNLGHYLITVNASMLERETKFFKNISLLDATSKYSRCKLSIGAGYGGSMLEIQRNARSALNKAKKQNASCVYVVHDQVNITGPIFREPSQLDAGGTQSNHGGAGEAASIAKHTGLGISTIEKLQYIIERYKSNTFTVNELALIYGVSQRSMYRIIDKLIKQGYAEENDRQTSGKAGRPSRIIQINLN